MAPTDDDTIEVRSYTSGQVARMLDIPARTVRRYLTNGSLPGTQNPITKTWTITRQDLEAFIRQHRLDPTTFRPLSVVVAACTPPVVRLVEQALNLAEAPHKLEQVDTYHRLMLAAGAVRPELLVVPTRELRAELAAGDGPKKYDTQDIFRSCLSALKGDPATGRVRILALGEEIVDLRGYALEQVIDDQCGVLDAETLRRHIVGLLPRLGLLG